MSRPKAFDNNYDFMCDYTAAMLGKNQSKWTVFLKNRTTSLMEVFKMPISEEGGLFNVEEQRLMSWEELAADYTFIDNTPCKSRSSTNA